MPIGKTNLIAKNVEPFSYANIQVVLSGECTVSDYLYVAIQLNELLGGSGFDRLMHADPHAMAMGAAMNVDELKAQIGANLQAAFAPPVQAVSQEGYSAPDPSKAPDDAKSFSPALVFGALQLILQLVKLFK